MSQGLGHFHFKRTAVQANATGCLVLIDFQDNLQALGFCPPDPTVTAALELLVIEAGRAGAPVLSTLYEARGVAPTPIESRINVPDHACYVRRTIDPWEDEDFRKSVADQGDARLILAGTWLEASLVQAGLSALREGFDVYVLADLFPSEKAEIGSLVLARLTQAGAVPITLPQLLFEWRADIALKSDNQILC